MRRLFGIGIVCTVTIATIPVLAGADPAPQSTLGWMIDGIVSEVVRAGDVAYLGGSFRTVTPAANQVPGFTTFSTRSARSVLPRLRPNGRVRAVASVPSGGWIIAGEFTSIDGTSRRRLARLLPDGSIDPTFEVLADSTVKAVAIAGNTLYVGGSFTTIDGQPRQGAAAIDLTTAGLVAAFAPAVTGGTVYDIAIDGSSVYLAGDFISVDAASRAGLARVDRTTGAVLPFDAAADGSVRRIIRTSDHLFAAGEFQNIGGLARLGLAKLNADSGAAVPGFDAQLNGTAKTIALGGSTLYVGGSFSQSGTSSRARLAAVDASTGSATPWNPGANGDVAALALHGTALIAAGSFEEVDGEERLYIAALDTTLVTDSLLPWNPALNDSADFATVDEAGTVFVAGSFTGFGAVRRDNLAAINLQRGDLASWNPGANGWIRALDIHGNTLYIGGDFTTIAGVSRSRVAAINARTAVAAEWNPAPNAPVYGLMVAGETVYFVGGFTSIKPSGSSLSRGRGAAIDVDGTVRSWNPAANADVETLFVDNTRVYIGGEFTMLGSATRNRLAAVNATDGAAINGFAPSVDNTIYRLDVQDGVVYFGGGFGSVNGLNRDNAAAVQGLFGDTPPPGAPSPGTLLAWNPSVGGPVYDLDVFGDAVYLAGGFGSVGGSSRPGIARVAADPDDAQLHSWEPTDVSGGAVSVIDTSDEAVLFGGLLYDLNNIEIGAVLYPDLSRPTAPHAPTTPEVRVNGSTMDLTWSRPPLGSAPASYVIEGGTAPGLANVANFPTGNSETTLSAVVPPGTYYLRMRSANAHGISGSTNELAFTVGAATCTAPPLAPLDVAAAVAGSEVTLSWRASPQSIVSRYIVRAAASSDGTHLATLDAGLATSLTVGAPAGAFFVTVVAANECGMSVPSEEAVAVVGGALVPPERPFNLAADVTGSTVRLSWAAPSIGTGPFQYVIEVGSGPGLSNIVVAASAVPELAAMGVAPGVYYVRVRAVGVAGTSPVSNEIAVVVQ